MAAADKILIVGAGGFIGGFIAAEALRRGCETYVAVRESTSRRYLADPRLHFVVLDYDAEPESIGRTLKEALAPGEKWRYIIYNLGATKCARFSDFNRINYEYLRTFVTALEGEDLVPDRFLYMSSLSALGPYDEKDYTPADASTQATPNTRYGLSKIKAETYLQTRTALPWIIFRPTGVYGPHEKDYLMMVKSIDRHIDVGVGFRRQMLTFIYVEDLVNAMFDALKSDRTVHRTYIISEPRAYTQAEFRSIVARALGRRFVLPLRLPLWALWCVSAVAEKIGALTLKPATLNRDKYHIMRQRNWTCSVADAVADFGFNPQWDLERGIAATVEEYHKK